MISCALGMCWDKLYAFIVGNMMSRCRAPRASAVRFVLAPRTLLARRRTTREGPRIELVQLAQSWADRHPLCADGGAPKSFFQPLGFRGTDQKIGIGNPPVSVLDCPRPGQPPDPVPGHHWIPRLSAGSPPIRGVARAR